MPIIVTCHQCGTALMRSPSQVTTHVFCDKDCRRRFITTPLPQRFWSRVHKTATCWLWQGARDSKGYGIVSTRPRADNPRSYYAALAHRVAWELTYGPLLVPGVQVCHNCPGGDNPRCVNPAHLFLGTQWDNMQDAIQKHGKPIRYAKLTEADVRRILRLRGTPSQAAIAAAFHVSASTIQLIYARKTWTHVDLVAVEELADNE